MQSLVVELGERSYSIEIGQGLLSNSKIWAPFCEGENVLVLTNKVVEPLYLDKVVKSLPHKKVHTFILPDGEVEKSLANYSLVLDFLIENGFRRNDTLIALGGGVIGDLGGFVAASYQRGMNFIQMPTTMLAQVDSSVGGKTAVNHPQGKNMIGAFYQPKIVVIDTDTLETLPKREFISGLAEVAKYALLGESELFELLTEQYPAVLDKNKDILSNVIYLSCRKKAQIVAEDEKESGSRALLNLGHTFGHAIEKVSGYRKFFHGEAVAIGTHMAINLSLSKSLITEAVANRGRALLNKLELPEFLSSEYEVGSLIDAMKLDKKNVSAKFRLVLPSDDRCVIVEESDLQLISDAIEKQYLN